MKKETENNHLKQAKTELKDFLNMPAKEHLEVGKVYALIAIAEQLQRLNDNTSFHTCTDFVPPANID